MKRMLFKWMVLSLALLLAVAILGGCMRSGSDSGAPEATQGPDTQGVKPKIPSKLSLDNGVPQLVVYDVDQKNYDKMDIERYLEGVLAGEMRNDWPMEALKAQAILARTYALKFIQDKQSTYEGADISTDIKEAQAYDAAKVNDRIKKAVQDTRGQVLSAAGELPIAWFHAHAGGMTELAVPGLDYKDGEPGYTQAVRSPESDKAPTAVKHWKASFTAEEVGKACADAGVRTGTVKTIEIGERGESGRAATLTVNGKQVSGPALRVALDAKKLKSMLLTSVSVAGDTVTFEGMGYGHGVGMSQWGAYGMAEQGEKANGIVTHYFKGVEVVNLWS